MPYFRRFEQSKGISNKENTFFEYPKCYRSVHDELQESLVLEDLSLREFKMIDKKEETTADHVILVMRALAKYHAISFAVQDQQPDKFKVFASKVSEVLFTRENIFVQGFIKNQSNATLEALSN